MIKKILSRLRRKKQINAPTDFNLEVSNLLFETPLPGVWDKVELVCVGHDLFGVKLKFVTIKIPTLLKTINNPTLLNEEIRS